MALAANFVIVPAVAFASPGSSHWSRASRSGCSCLAPRPVRRSCPLSDRQGERVAFSVGLMTMLIIVTIVYLPIVLPLLLPGVKVDAGKIALR